MFKNLFASLQKVGKSLMLPVSVLPVAGILLGVGAADLPFIPEIVSNLMEQAGGSVFGQMALLFAVGVALGFKFNDLNRCPYLSLFSDAGINAESKI